MGRGVGECSLRFRLGLGVLDRALGLGFSGFFFLSSSFFSFSFSFSFTFFCSALWLRVRLSGCGLAFTLGRASELELELPLLLEEELERELEPELELRDELDALDDLELLSEELRLLLPLPLDEDGAFFFLSRPRSFLFSLSDAPESESLLALLLARRFLAIFFFVTVSTGMRKGNV